MQLLRQRFSFEIHTILRIPKESVCSNFFEAAIFLERLFLRSINCNYFFRAATSSVILENILRRVNSFQQNSYFFKLLSSSNFLMKSKLAVLQSRYFWVDKIVQNKAIQRRASFLEEMLLNSTKFFYRAYFFNGGIFLQKRYCFKTATLSDKLFFGNS